MYKNLKLLRDMRNMNQKEFAASLGISYTTYNGYETGARDPKPDSWIAVAEKYGVSIDWLMGFEPAAGSKKAPSQKDWSQKDALVVKDGAEEVGVKGHGFGKGIVPVAGDEQVQQVVRAAQRRRDPRNDGGEERVS